jgi:hypothetical protein
MSIWMENYTHCFKEDSEDVQNQENHLDFLRRIYLLNPNLIMNIIHESKELLGCESSSFRVIGCSLLRTFTEIDEKMLDTFLETGLFKLILKLLAFHDDFFLFSEIFSVLSPMLHLMMKTKRMHPLVDIFCNKLINFFIHDDEEYIMTPILSRIIKYSHELQYPLEIDRYEIMNIILEAFERGFDFDMFLQLITVLFQGPFDCDVNKGGVQDLIDLVLESHPESGYSNDSFMCLISVFHSLRLNSRPWFQEAFEICKERLNSIYSSNWIDFTDLHFCTQLMLTIIQIFKDEVEPMVASSNVIELLIRITKV